MRTSVYTNPNDPEETDEFPECWGCVEEDGGLSIVQFEGSGIETVYQPGQWSSYEVTAS